MSEESEKPAAEKFPSLSSDLTLPGEQIGIVGEQTVHSEFLQVIAHLRAYAFEVVSDPARPEFWD